MRPKRIFLVLCSTLALSAGCGTERGASTENGNSADGFRENVQAVFDAHCVQCHAAELPQAGLVLEDGESYDMLVGVKSLQTPMLRVAPGDPQASYLIHKLKATHLAVGGSGLGMPLTEGNHTPLGAEVIARIEDWVRSLSATR